ncbi:hypothetical protein [Prosthecobacter sp.]|uniref:hypothetical protein n=1 Tax=Prosthecobacter sp. TaxID=1965333 RepID=UPI0037849737
MSDETISIRRVTPGEPPSRIGTAFDPFAERKKHMAASKENQVKPDKPDEPMVLSPNPDLSLARKKIIGSGVLVICIASMVHASNERESPSLGWMLALSSTWALSAWLWPTHWNFSFLRSKIPMIKKVMAHLLAWSFISIGPLLIISAFLGLGPFSADEMKKREDEKKAKLQSLLPYEYRSLIK